MSQTIRKKSLWILLKSEEMGKIKPNLRQKNDLEGTGRISFIVLGGGNGKNRDRTN